MTILTLNEVTANLPEFFDRLNYGSYAANRPSFDSPEAAMVAFVKMGIGNLVDVQRWEARYQEEHDVVSIDQK